MQFKAAVLRAPKTPLQIETVELAPLRPGDVLVRIKAAGLCHTDLEVIEGDLAFPLPIVLGHEASGIVAAVGGGVASPRPGQHVILQWNPSCGHCFYCDRDQPILCETYLANGPRALPFDGSARLHQGGTVLHNLMYLGAFADYCVVPAQCVVPVDPAIPFDRACLIGCGVMTGVGAATRIAGIGWGDTAMVVGCGAVGLAAVQGARLAGAAKILAVDIDAAKLDLAARLGATHVCNAGRADAAGMAKSLTGGRGADVVLESAGSAEAFRTTVEAVRPGGQVVWLGKINAQQDVRFRWGALMQEKRLVRSSYGGARPQRDFPLLVGAYLQGDLRLDDLISRRIRLDQINDGFAALKQGAVIRAVVVFDEA